jgi:hypothetical protein
MLQGKGSRYRGAQTLALVPPDARREVPAFPADTLPEEYRADWDAYWASAVAQMALGIDVRDVTRYFLLWSRREALEADIYCEAGQDAEKGPVVLGANDTPVMNPKVRIVKEVTREIEKYREQLGYLALPRMRLGVTANQFANTSATAQMVRERIRTAPPRPAGGVIDLDAMA